MQQLDQKDGCKGGDFAFLFFREGFAVNPFLSCFLISDANNRFLPLSQSNFFFVAYPLSISFASFTIINKGFLMQFSILSCFGDRNGC